MKRLSAAEIEQMTPLIGTVSDADLARRFGVTRARVHQIRVGLGIAAAAKPEPAPAKPPYDRSAPRPECRKTRDLAKAARLLEWRRASGRTQAEVGEALGITGVAVHLKERGKVELTAADVAAIDARYPGAAAAISGGVPPAPDLPMAAIEVLALKVPAKALTGPLAAIMGRAVSATDVRGWRIQHGLRRTLGQSRKTT